MKYQFILEHPEYPVTRWARQLQIERTGYYVWRAEREERERKGEHIKATIKKIFQKSKNTYGPRRIARELKKAGIKIGHKRCAAYMEELGLSSIHNRNRSKSLTNSKKARGEGYPNLLKAESPIAPRYALSSDITYIRTDDGFDYLCMVKDIVSGEILGSCQGERMTKDLVIQAFLSVQARHQLADGCIFHSDRGSQYTSKAFMELLKKYGIRQSFSRVGTPGDNAWAESFFATMKKECIHWAHFHNREEARVTVFEYIYSFYNGQRIQKRLGYLSPKEYYDSLQIGELLLAA